MTAARPIRTSIFAIVLFLFAALVAREFLRRYLLDAGIANNYAKDLSYLIVPIILGFLFWPVLRQQWPHLHHVFRFDALTAGTVVSGILVGILLRIAWWSQLVVRISLGISGSENPVAITGPVLRFDCPELAVASIGVLVMVILVPVVEETTHRGLVLSGLLHRGTSFAILISTAIFAACHNPSTFVAVYVIGLVLALQYTVTGALWFSLVTHATYNGLIQLDWHCVTGQWNPAAEQVPMPFIALASGTLLLASALAISWLVLRERWQPSR